MFLFNSNFWYGVLAMVIICFVLWLCITKKEARPYVYTLGSLALLAVTSWCILQLNFYYSAEGGIFGKISGLIQSNIVEESEEATFTLKNIVLSQNDEGEYSAIISSSIKLKPFEEENYAIFINGEPCSNSIYTPAINSGTVRAEYHYVFKNDDLEPLCDDILKLNFAYYSNGYQIKLSTEGGQTAVNYWNTYFTRNNFVVTVEPFNFQSNDQIDFVEGDISNYRTITYYVDENEYLKSVCEVGKTITTFPTPYKSKYTFAGWTTSQEQTSTIDSLTIVNDVSLYAIFTEGEIVFESKWDCSIENFTTTSAFKMGKSSFSDLMSLNMDEDKFSVTFEFCALRLATDGGAIVRENITFYSNPCSNLGGHTWIESENGEDVLTIFIGGTSNFYARLPADSQFITIDLLINRIVLYP